MLSIDMLQCYFHHASEWATIMTFLWSWGLWRIMIRLYFPILIGQWWLIPSASRGEKWRNMLSTPPKWSGDSTFPTHAISRWPYISFPHLNSSCSPEEYQGVESLKTRFDTSGLELKEISQRLHFQLTQNQDNGAAWNLTHGRSKQQTLAQQRKKIATMHMPTVMTKKGTKNSFFQQ